MSNIGFKMVGNKLEIELDQLKYHTDEEVIFLVRHFQKHREMAVIQIAYQEAANRVNDTLLRIGCKTPYCAPYDDTMTSEEVYNDLLKTSK